MYNPLGLTSRMHQISADHLEVSTNRVGFNPVGKHMEKTSANHWEIKTTLHQAVVKIIMAICTNRQLL